MASETEASCESDPNFAIICAFMEKFGALCGIPSIDFVELQQMLENNQEVPLDLINLHIKLLRKTKKNVTVERWERALINMCHTFSSKDAWEIERFGYKKTRLQIKLRALKELLEMQFDYNTKFKNEINKIDSENLRSQPLGRDKLGRAYWFQTDNNYQIRIYKEDPDEETWNLIAKDKEGLLSLINELNDGDSKLSSDSACNEDSNSLLEKPFLDTGQNGNSDESKTKEEDVKNTEEKSEKAKLETEQHTEVTAKESVEQARVCDENTVVEKGDSSRKVLDVKGGEISNEKTPEPAEVKRPMLRIKSLSELMEKPKEPPKDNFFPDLPEVTIIKKHKFDLPPEISIVKKPKLQAPYSQSSESTGNKSSNVIVGNAIEEPVVYFAGRGSGRDCESGDWRITSSCNQETSIVVGEEIEEPVMYFVGRGSGVECYMENEKQSLDVDGDKSKNFDSAEIEQVSNEVPISNISNVKLGTVIDSKTDSKSFSLRDPSKKSRWDQKESEPECTDENNESTISPKKTTFFFGPGSLNVKPVSNTNLSDSENSEKKSGELVSENVDVEVSNCNNTTEDISENNINDDEPSETLEADVPEGDLTKEDPTIEHEVEDDVKESTEENEALEQSKDLGENEIINDVTDMPEADEQVVEGSSTKEQSGEVDNTESVATEAVESVEEAGSNKTNEEETIETSTVNDEISDTKVGHESVSSEDEKEKGESELDLPDSTKIDPSAQRTDEEQITSSDLGSTKTDRNEDKLNVNSEDPVCDETKIVDSANVESDENILRNKIDVNVDGVTENADCDTVKVDGDTENVDGDTENVDGDTGNVVENKIDDKIDGDTLENKINNSTIEVQEASEKIEKVTENEEDISTQVKNADGLSEEVAETQSQNIGEVENIQCQEDHKDSTKENDSSDKPSPVDTTEKPSVNNEDTKPEIEEIKDEKKEPEKAKIVETLQKSGKKEVTTKLKSSDEISKEEPDEIPSKRKRMPRNVSQATKTVENETPPIETPRTTRTRGQPRESKLADSTPKTKPVQDKVDPVVKLEKVEITPSRPTRQTRSLKVETPTPAAKGKGKTKKTPARSSKNSNDSLKPLESVTVIDAGSAAPNVADNAETDPLAVSDDESQKVDETVTPSLNLSIDYSPNSPATNPKRNLRKRGRESLENKPEPGETGGKKPKMKGKRTIDANLRKSVEEKRQQKVGDVSSDENESKDDAAKEESKIKVKKTPGRKKAVSTTVSDSDNATPKSDTKSKSTPRTNRMLKSLGVKEEDITAISETAVPVRQSRRLAQIKIKEDASRRKIEEEDNSGKKKKKKLDDKDFKAGKRKRIEEEVKPAPTTPHVEKKRGRKKNKVNKISIGWNTSSDDSDASCPEEEEVSEYEEPHEEEPLQFKSDHEFSPESDMENDEPLPLKRARTARKEETDDEEVEEEFPCQKCGKSDHPEWILLCDSCDNGWHCSCLRPALFVIPEGNWYCPTCQHNSLLDKLHEKLVEYDKMLLKKEMEDRRKERLAYVGISLNNVLPAKEKKDKPKSASEESSFGGSETGDSSDSDEPIYRLRQRRQAHSYKFQDYDDLINSALQEEPRPPVVKTHTLGRGKDIATIVNAAKEEEERNAEKNGFDDLPPVVPRSKEEAKKKALTYRKKPKRLNNLEVNSDDEADDSDEDFKGSSSDESEEEDYAEDSDDSFVGKRSSKAVRRSTRARTTRFDADFINDEDSDDAPTKKKKKRRSFISDSESEISDDWRGGKKKTKKRISHKKTKKKKIYYDDSDLEVYRKKKPKIKYGIESDVDIKARRTRGKRTSYLDTLGSDSEEEAFKEKVKSKSEDDEYVAEEEDKESEDEFEPEMDKLSETGAGDKNGVKHSDSEDDAPLTKNLRTKKRRAFIDSEDEEDEEKEEAVQKTEDANLKLSETSSLNKAETPPVNINEDKSTTKTADLPLTKPEIPREPVVTKTIEPVPKAVIAEPVEAVVEKPSPPLVVPMLNVERLKACGITVTKVIKDKNDPPLNMQDDKSPRKIIEIGSKPSVANLNKISEQKILPVTIEKFERDLDDMDEEEIEEMMESEEYANKQLQLASLHIQQTKRMKQAMNSFNPISGIPRDLSKPHVPTMMNRKPGDNTLKKVRTEKFFNWKPSQEPLIANSASMMMQDDDNDELSEPPGVNLPLFSGISSNNNATQSSGGGIIPNNLPPPLMGPNRATPVLMHNIGPQYPSNPFHSTRPVGMNSQIKPVRPTAPHNPLGINLSASLSISKVPNVSSAISGRVPPVSTSGSATTLSFNAPTNNGTTTQGGPPHSTPMDLHIHTSNAAISSAAPMGPIRPPRSNTPTGNKNKASTPPGSSPEGTPKKRRGRGKGKKTLAAEAAAASGTTGVPVSEAVAARPPSGKPLVTNIEIASPPQPFSQSQPAPSVITRMLQTSPGKGAFPVGRIRPKLFAMMPDSDNDSEETTRPIESHTETGRKNIANAPPTAAHYGAPTPGQFPPNYYQKDGQPPPLGFHHQRQPPPSMHPFPPTQSNQPPPIDQSLNNQPPPATSQSSMEMPDSTPPRNQYTSPPIPAKSSYESMPQRPPYPSQGYNNYNDYNNTAAPPPIVNTDEGLPLPTSYENQAAYPEQYPENPETNQDSSSKNIEDETSGEFGGLVSYFSSQHEDDLDT